MNLAIHTDALTIRLFGASMPHNKASSYGAEIRGLLDRVWPAIRANKLAHKGINWVLYNADCSLFAGVELEIDPSGDLALEPRDVHFTRYAVWKHIGPYDKLADAYAGMKRAMATHGISPGHPFIEKYGHWSDDPSKLETDLICPIIGG